MFLAVTASIEGKMGKTLKKMLKKLVVKDVQETLAVADAKLGNCIKVLTANHAHKFNSVT